MRRAEHSSNEVRGPIVAVDTSHDVSQAMTEKCYNPYFPLKYKKWDQRIFNRNTFG